MIRAGKLRHRVTIQQPSPARQANGEAVASWTDVCQTWAAIEPVAGWYRAHEIMKSETVSAQVSTIITIRHRAGIDATMRVVFGAHVYDIIAPLDVHETHRELQLMCIERQVAAA